MSTTAPGRVILEDVGVDAALVRQPGREPVLVLRPGQSFASAVASAQGCLAVASAQGCFPNVHPDVVRSMVRDAMPKEASFSALSETMSDAWMPGASQASPRAVHALRRRQRVMAVGVGLGAGVALTFAGLGVAWGVGEQHEADLEAFSSARFGNFARTMGIACTPLSPLTARCTDIHGNMQGGVMLAEAEIANDHWTYTFKAGSESTVVMVFEDDATAAAWVVEHKDTLPPALSHLDGEPVSRDGAMVTFGADLDALDRIVGSVPSDDMVKPLVTDLEDAAESLIEGAAVVAPPAAAVETEVAPVAVTPAPAQAAPPPQEAPAPAAPAPQAAPAPAAMAASRPVASQPVATGRQTAPANVQGAAGRHAAERDDGDGRRGNSDRSRVGGDRGNSAWGHGRHSEGGNSRLDLNHGDYQRRH